MKEIKVNHAGLDQLITDVLKYNRSNQRIKIVRCTYLDRVPFDYYAQLTNKQWRNINKGIHSDSVKNRYTNTTKEEANATRGTAKY